jgi:hypothetical protein
MVVTSILLVGRPSSSTQIVFCFETKISRLNGMGQLCLSQRDSNVHKIHLWFRPGFTQSPFANPNPVLFLDTNPDPVFGEQKLKNLTVEKRIKIF